MASQTKETTCKELVELLTDYLEGALSHEDKLRFEEHLALCAGCRAYLDQMRATIGALGRLEEESIPPQAKEDLLRVFRAWKA